MSTADGRNQRVGTCSLCGGAVYGHRGAYWSTVPPPPDECSACGAVAAGDVIQMAPRPMRYTRAVSANGLIYELPDPLDAGSTHFEGCWKHRGHHNCAVSRIYELEAKP